MSFVGHESLADIAAELYAGPPAEFIAARTGRAKDAGSAELSSQIRALRKPSVAAWVVNLFARERADRLGQALQLAEELREAQADLDAATLAQLGRQRRALTDQLARDAAALATARGGQVTPATMDAVRQTIAAAFFDPDAAAAVASGRLVRELAASGAPTDLDEVVAGGRPAPLTRTTAPTDEVAARRERRAAEARMRDAEQALLRAKRDQSKAQEETRDLARRIDELSRRESELEAALADARDTLASARAAVPGGEERGAAAAAAVDAAQRLVEEAKAALAAQR